jgi:hypothetical protein
MSSPTTASIKIRTQKQQNNNKNYFINAAHIIFWNFLEIYESLKLPFYQK